jgi:AcrR family transcriptional regulator
VSSLSYEVIWMRPDQWPKRGPAPAYSRDQITATAIKIADAEGLDALTMRRLAKELGSGTMSLYRYVKTKDELLELMTDEVLGEAFPEDFRLTGAWRPDLRTIAHRMRSSLRRHPWMATRAHLTMGPNTLRAAEVIGSSLDDLGLTIDQIMSLTGMVQNYVSGAAREELAEAEFTRRTGLSRDELMHVYAPYLRKMLATGRYPLMERIIREAEQPHMEPDERFEYGLERILDGIEGSLPDRPPRSEMGG